MCASHQRYGEHAAGELAGECVPVTADPSTSAADDANGSSDTSGDPSPTTDEATGVPGSSTSTDDGPPITDTGESGNTGSSESTGPAGTSCDEQYATLPDYMLCMETETVCHVYTTHDVSCTDHCHAHGGECSEAFENVTGGGCQVEAAITCDTTRGGHAICVCSIGCGDGPACVAPLTCQSGTCA